MFGWLQRLFSGSPTTREEPAKPVVRAAAAAPQPVTSAAVAVPALPAAPARPAAPALAARPPVSFDQLDRVNGAWDAWLFERGAGGGIETNPFETAVLEALGAILSSRQSGAALVRRMPGLIPQLLQSLRSDSFSGAALSRTISSDVVLVAEVVRLANSSFMGTGTSINSVEHAVMLIGQEGLRQLITGVAFRPIIDMNSGYYTRTLAPRLWEHGERCAIANRRLADEMGIEPFDAFLAGLLQNVGMIVALRIMDQASGGARELGSEMFCAHVARAARTLAVSIAREWDFSPAVVTALGEQGGVRKGVQISPLGRLTMMSDYLAKLHALAASGLLDGTDPSLVHGLPPNADECWRLLAELAARADTPA
jgi:HD-like signal output (HDOD) protein